MKKQLFHIAVCIALFCFLSLTFLKAPEKINTHEVSKIENSSFSELHSDERAYYIGKPVEIITLPETVKRREEATIKFKGEALAEYSVSVYYSSGLSTSKSLSPVSADSTGIFGWSWKIPKTAKTGEIRIVVTSKNSYLATKLEITE